MTRTEKIIADNILPSVGQHSALIAELRRIAALNAAMWEECVRAYHLLDRDGSYLKRGGALGDRKRAYQIARQATDAARLKAGETT